MSSSVARLVTSLPETIFNAVRTTEDRLNTAPVELEFEVSREFASRVLQHAEAKVLTEGRSGPGVGPSAGAGPGPQAHACFGSSPIEGDFLPGAGCFFAADKKTGNANPNTTAAVIQALQTTIKAEILYDDFRPPLVFVEHSDGGGDLFPIDNPNLDFEFVSEPSPGAPFERLVVKVERKFPLSSSHAGRPFRLAFVFEGNHVVCTEPFHVMAKMGKVGTSMKPRKQKSPKAVTGRRQAVMRVIQSALGPPRPLPDPFGVNDMLFPSLSASCIGAGAGEDEIRVTAASGALESDESSKSRRSSPPRSRKRARTGRHAEDAPAEDTHAAGNTHHEISGAVVGQSANTLNLPQTAGDASLSAFSAFRNSPTQESTLVSARQHFARPEARRTFDGTASTAAIAAAPAASEACRAPSILQSASAASAAAASAAAASLASAHTTMTASVPPAAVTMVAPAEAAPSDGSMRPPPIVGFHYDPRPSSPEASLGGNFVDFRSGSPSQILDGLSPSAWVFEAETDQVEAADAANEASAAALGFNPSMNAPTPTATPIATPIATPMVSTGGFMTVPHHFDRLLDHADALAGLDGSSGGSPSGSAWLQAALSGAEMTPNSLRLLGEDAAALPSYLDAL